MLFLDTETEIPEISNMYDAISDLMAEKGVRLHSRIFEMRKKANADKATAMESIKSFYGIENPNSTKEWNRYLDSNFSHNADVVATLYNNDKCSWSTDGKKMALLIHMDADRYKFATNLVAYRRIKKHCETIDNLLKYCDKYGIIRPTVSMGKTNRINYSEPALMNIPKKLLWGLLAPRKDGNILISVDIKNQEPWILINMLNIKELKEIIRNNPLGLYNGIYDRVYGGEPIEIQRDEVKTAWNALTYGATKFGVGQICMNIDSDLICKYFNSIKELKEYTGRCYGKANNKYRDVKTVFGTELRADGKTKGEIRRQLMDLPIQGTGSDILALLIENFDSYVRGRQLIREVTLYFPRHDELIIEIDRDYFNKVGEAYVMDMARDMFEHQIDDWDPFQVKISRVDTAWEEAALAEDEEE